MKIVIVTQARMTSTRLPGKVLKMVLGKTLLEYQIERLHRVPLVDDVIVATTTEKSDDAIVELCTRLGVTHFRGSEHDVLRRYYEAAKAAKADAVVRVTSDCPIIDPKIISQMVRYFLDHWPDFDYVSNTLERTFPRGMDTEVFSYQALECANKMATLLAEREHVTPYIYRNPGIFKTANVSAVNDNSFHRWTVDTPEDFELIDRIITTLYSSHPEFGCEDVLELLRKNQSWIRINQTVEQKEII